MRAPTSAPVASPTSAPLSGPEARVLVVGDVLDDVIVAPARPPRQNADVVARIQHRAGGSAANTAAWLGTQGVRVEFLGRVGVGDLQRHSQLLANAGVVPRLEYAADGHTGTVVITLEGTSRTMLSDRGASAGLDLDGVAGDLIDDVAIVHTTGYTVLSARQPVSFRRLITRVRGAGALVSVDPATTGLIQEFGVDEFLDITSGADFFFPSLTEGRLLTGLKAPDEVLRALIPHFGVVAMFLPDGSAIAGRKGSKPVHSPRVATRVVDPIGAGDAFAAGFLGGWLHSPSLALSTRRGVKVSAQALAVVGGRPSR